MTQNSDKLQHLLAQRPSKDTLLERNILKASSAAPSLVATQLSLEKHQLEDSLDRDLSKRPTQQQLRERGILE